MLHDTPLLRKFKAGKLPCTNQKATLQASSVHGSNPGYLYTINI